MIKSEKKNSLFFRKANITMDPILKNQTMIKFNMMMILIKRVTPVTRRVTSQVQFHIIFLLEISGQGEAELP